MSTEENRTAIRRFVESFNTGRTDSLGEFISPECTFRGPGTPPDIRGPEGFKQVIGVYRAAFPDVHLDIDEEFCTEDRGAVCWHATGTQKGELFGLPPTGKHARVTAINVFHFSGGKITDSRIEWDMLGMMQQLGVVPTAQQGRRAA